MTGAPDPRLDGRKVLVVEDEYYLADDLRRALVAHGADVIGPANTVDRARALVRRERPDLAILDIELRGELVFPFADELSARGIPFVFLTGYEAGALPPRYRDVVRWEKPSSVPDLIRAIEALDLG